MPDQTHVPPISNDFIADGAEPFDRPTIEQNARCSRCGDFILGGTLCDDDRPYPLGKQVIRENRGVLDRLAEEDDRGLHPATPDERVADDGADSARGTVRQ